MLKAKTDENFFIMARTDSYAIEGLQASIDRASAYIEAGADGIFAEAMASLDEYQAYDDAIAAPPWPAGLPRGAGAVSRGATTRPMPPERRRCVTRRRAAAPRRLTPNLCFRRRAQGERRDVSAARHPHEALRRLRRGLLHRPPKPHITSTG